jgi:hypothetical protein
MPRGVADLRYLSASVLPLAAGTQEWTHLVFPAGVLMVSVGIPNTRPVHPAH